MINTQELDYFSNALFSNAHTFEFDNVLSGDKSNNKKFYHKVLKPYTKNLLKGKNSTIFLFGPSHGGKSYLLNGGINQDDGIIHQSVEDVFEFIDLSNQTGEPLILKISSFMIYLEKVVDLLNPKKMGAKLDHFLSASKEEVISKITNLKEKIVPSISDFKNLMLEISRNK